MCRKPLKEGYNIYNISINNISIVIIWNIIIFVNNIIIHKLITQTKIYSGTKHSAENIKYT